jgi:hypothetical protein
VGSNLTKIGGPDQSGGSRGKGLRGAKGRRSVAGRG